jgi:tRNA A37 threonylcarbamoyladenosine synthetase subunit TsaC/SUA5/YrdC
LQRNPVRIIDLDETKPELQAVRAAQELLEANYPIVFPCDTMHSLLMRYSAENAKTLHALTGQTAPFTVLLSEDADWQKLAATLSAAQADLVMRAWPGPDRLVLPKSSALAYPEEQTITLSMPALGSNRAFHTLVQLCDFPLLAAPLVRAPGTVIAERTAAAEVFATLEYGFWGEKFTPAAEPQVITV